VTHLLRALEEFDYLGIRFISVQDQVDTASPMGKAMFTIIGAMAELEGASRVPVTPFYTGPEQTPAGHVSGTISPSSRAWLS
jgi:hypothetical protein